jgi:hypothetical protein
MEQEFAKEEGYRPEPIIFGTEGLLKREFTTAGVNALARHCGIPGGYLNKVYKKDKDLFESNVKYWGTAVDIVSTHKMILKNDMVTGICKKSFELIPAGEIVEKVAEMFQKRNWEGEITNLAVSPSDTYVSVVFDDVVKDASNVPNVHDLSNAGFTLSHSMLGEYTDYLASYVNRLVCSNGAEVHDERYGFRKDLDESYMNYFPVLEDGITQSRDIGRSALERFVYLKNQKVTDSIAAVTSMGQRMGVAPRGINIILKELSNKEVENLYDVMNLYTFWATHSNDDPFATRGLQRKAGSLLDAQLCEHCQQIITKLNTN